MFLKFRTIVGQHKDNRIRKYLNADIKEFLGSKTGMAACAPGKGKSGKDVLKGNDVPSHPIDKLLNRIQGHEMAGVLGFKIFRFSKDFLSIGLLNFSEMGYFLGKHS